MSRLMHAIAALTILAVVASVPLTVAGAAATKRIPLKEYARRMDARCKRTSAKIKAIPSPKSSKQVEGYFRRVLKVAEPELRRMKAVPLPSTKTGTARGALVEASKELRLFRTMVREMAAGKDPTKVLRRHATALKRSEDRQNAAWSALGARVCAS
jgi:hypothetical protein